MDIIRAFNANTLHTNIVISGTTEEPLFRASDIGEVLELSNIRANIQFFDETEKVVNTIDTLGGSQQVTFLTEKGLYKVLFKSRKPIAETFQNWVCDVIKEIRLKGVYDLKKQLENVNQNFDKKLEQEKRLQKQDILLKKYNLPTALVYIIKVKTYENGEYIVKIGESRNGIESRYNEHKKNYEECLLLDCFEVNKSKQFETFLHHHEKIRPNRVKDYPNHERENELFKIDNNLTYAMFLKIVNDNIKNFDEWKVNDIIDIIDERNKKFLDKITNSNHLENTFIPTENIATSHLLQKIQDLETINKTLVETNSKLVEKIEQLENRAKPAVEIRTQTGFNTELVTLGPRLQKINPETMTLIKTYESVAECIKESNFKLKRPTIEKAIKENTIYNGFRWLYVGRNEDPNKIENIQPTKITRPQNLGYIAKLDLNKTKIINVYLDRKTASTENGYQSSSALDEPVKSGKPSRDFLYMLYDKCDDVLRKEFEEEYGEPVLYKDGIGKFNDNENLIMEYVCKYDCIKQEKMSDKTLAKALEQKLPYNGFYYKKLDKKIKMCMDL